MGWDEVRRMFAFPRVAEFCEFDGKGFDGR